MIKLNHYIGGILLVSGTTIGAGMLALPVTTGFMGFFPSMVLFVICYLVMLATAFFFLDVNFAVPGEINLITMAGKTLGRWGKVTAWIFYLLLLYALAAAYISGSAPLFTRGVYALTGWNMPHWLGPFSLPLIFSFFVYLGTLGVDLINRVLMAGLVISYLVVVGFLPDDIKPTLLTHIDFSPAFIALPVIITSFGFHIIIPTLTTYMHHDRKHLRRMILIGSFIPLIIYLLWQVVVLGIVPITGSFSLAHAWVDGSSATDPLVSLVSHPWIRIAALYFAFFAIVTSFLGVSLSLSDFLTDGLKIKKGWKGRLLACALTFIPPLIFVFSYPRGFILALEYAGAFVAVLLIILPSCMAWTLKKPTFYRTINGRLLLIAMILFGFLVIVVDILQELGCFKSLIAQYV